jgi:hypothetical protein
LQLRAQVQVFPPAASYQELRHGAQQATETGADGGVTALPLWETNNVREKPVTHPIQPLIRDEQGVLRFKRNAIVRYLLDCGPFDMNHLAMMDFTDKDREQFAQLIGYSLSGFGELSYVSDETYEKAANSAIE